MICDCVHVYEWVAEVGGEDVGGLHKLHPHKSIEDVGATTSPHLVQAGDWGMTIICTTATCACTVVKMKNLLFISFA